MTTTKNLETPAVDDGTGLAEALLGLDGFRVDAVPYLLDARGLDLSVLPALAILVVLVAAALGA